MVLKNIKNTIAIFAYFVFVAFLLNKYYTNNQNIRYFDYFNLEKNEEVVSDNSINSDLYLDNGILDPYYNINNINIDKILNAKDTDVKQKLIDLLNEFAHNDLKRLYKYQLEEYYELLDGSKLIGDSMVRHLHNYNLIDYKYYVAFPGKSINYIKENIDEHISSVTKNVIFWTGYNIALFEDANDYVNTYQQLYDKVKEINPNTNVYICSLMPATKEAIDNDLKGDFVHNLYKGYEYDLALKNHFADNYLDIKFLAKKDYYGPDGIHFRVELYNMLIRYLAYYINLEY